MVAKPVAKAVDGEPTKLRRLAKRFIFHQLIATIVEVWNMISLLKLTHVIADVVIRRHQQNDDVGRILPNLLPERDQFLRGAIAGHTEVDDFDMLPFELVAALKLLL